MGTKAMNWTKAINDTYIAHPTEDVSLQLRYWADTDEWLVCLFVRERYLASHLFEASGGERAQEVVEQWYGHFTSVVDLKERP
jgi:hypothetical protein